ncbi:MAG: glycosyltransferase family 4 protein [Sediminibacterium sp.]
MRIAINTRLLIPGKLEGIGRFTFETIKRMAHRFPEHEFHLLSDRKKDDYWQFGKNVIQHRVFPPARRPWLFDWWFDYSVPFVLKKIKADIFVSPDAHASRRCPVPQLTVIHDINFVHYPEFMPKKYANYWNSRTADFVKLSTRLATVSEFSRADISKTFNVSETAIDVLCNGIDHTFVPVEEHKKEVIRDRFSQGKKYFLFVGALHPRKNIHRVVEAFNAAVEQGVESSLVIAGNKFWNYPELDSALAKINYRTNIRFLGHVHTADLPVLMSAAEGLIFPSLYEGFGIPLIEAEACGVPVVASKGTVMEEVSNGSAFFVNPTVVSEIAEAIVKIEQGQRNPAMREHTYTWDKAAELLWESIQQTLQHKK